MIGENSGRPRVRPLVSAVKRMRTQATDPPDTGWLRIPRGDETPGSTKLEILERGYEALLAPLRSERFVLLELGVASGHSLAMWRDGFPRATIVGVDRELPDVDLGPRVHLRKGDQADAELLAGLRRAYAPDGFAVIIDDASHLAALTARSLQALFSRHLRPGGLYVVEDWETGFFPEETWPDGGRYATELDVSTLDAADSAEGPARMPSHDHGMVGLTKRLVDHVAGPDIQNTTPVADHRPLPIESLTIRKGMVVLQRAAENPRAGSQHEPTPAGKPGLAGAVARVRPGVARARAAVRRMVPHLNGADPSPPPGWLRMPRSPEFQVWVKSFELERAYEALLAPLRERPFAMLELGVERGDSMIMWRDGFRHATLVGVDRELPDVDLGPRVHLAKGDQSDAEFLTRLRNTFAPDGFEVIIDDASHLGVVSARSLQALFIDHLRPGGMYVIEDWQSGYFPSTFWPDAAELTGGVDAAELDAVVGEADHGRDPSRMPSHDYGMVGLVKRLVDHVAAPDIRSTAPSMVHRPLPLESMTIRRGIVILRRHADTEQEVGEEPAPAKRG